MNLKSVAMATGLVLTFASGAWLSTMMLAPPKRSNQVAVQDQAPVARPIQQLPQAPLPQNRLERLPDIAASDSILPPLPPLPPSPTQTHPTPPPVAEEPAVEPPVIAAPAPPSPTDQAAQAPEPVPPAIDEVPPAMAEAPPPETQPVPVVEAAPEPLAPAIPDAPPAEMPQKADIDSGFAALSDLVARAPSVSTPPPSPTRRAPSPAAANPSPPPSPSHPAPSPAPVGSQAAGPYFTIQVGSFQDPANAASLTRSLGVKGWEAFVVDWANSTGQIWKVVRVGRYQTEAQAVSASAELMSAANLRGNVIKVR